MEELIEKVENLKDVLDSNSSIIKIKELNDKIMKEEELLDDISAYQKYPNDTLRSKIINNKLYLEYKKSEAEINFIILKVNQELKKINPKGGSCR